MFRASVKCEDRLFDRNITLKTVIVLPTYNEAENLAEMISALQTLPLEKLTIIIVDDNSPDGTGKIADDLAHQYSEQIIVAHRPSKLGLGTAYALGLQKAVALSPDAIIQMDADFSHSPDYIPQMIARLADYDVIVGSRYVEGGGTDRRWSRWRYLLSWWANQVYTRLVLGIRVQDSTAGFKAYRRSSLEEIDLRNVTSNGYVFQVEMAYISQKLGHRVLEVPIYFEDRRIGKSKMDIPVKLEAIWRVWQIRWRYKDVEVPISHRLTKPSEGSW
jgi:dolichol-phosphate mannosyltransferase